MPEAEQPCNGLLEYVKLLDSLSYKGSKLGDLHKLRGTMSGSVLDQHGEVYELGQDEGGVFENVAEHTAMAMLITDVLGEAFGLPPQERGYLNLAAWEHDSGKKTERMWQRVIEEAEKNPETGSLLTDEFIPKGKTRKILTQEQIVKMEEWENAEAGIGSPRVQNLMDAIVPKSAEGHGNDLAAKIIWFTDACLSGATIKPIAERFDALETDPVNGARNKEFSDGYKTDYNGLSLYDVQRLLGERYETEFTQRLQIGTGQLYSWLTEKVNERIQSQRLPQPPSNPQVA